MMMWNRKEKCRKTEGGLITDVEENDYCPYRGNFLFDHNVFSGNPVSLLPVISL